MNIYLIGYRAVGKSSVGRSLASTLDRVFTDTDCELSRHTGMTISQFVHERGWAAFRELERFILQQICKQDRQVVATGGGVVLDLQNTESMRSTGTLIWLKASPQTIRNRLMNDRRSGQTRPPLTPQGSIIEIEEILNQRTPYYERAMDLSIETDGMSIAQICDEIVSQLSEAEK
jgi:shikimate kinase